MIRSCSILLAPALLISGCETPGGGPVPGAEAGKTSGLAAPSTPRAYPLSSAASLDDLVSAALGHHPSLEATRARIVALEQSAIQARALPDPTAMAGTGRMAETAAGRVAGTLGVQQSLPAPGKRGARAAVALRTADAMRAQLASEELAIAERVRSTYWNYYAASMTVEVVAEARGPLVTLRESIEARVAANKASQQDLLRLENEITRLDQRAAIARGRVEAARASLNALLFRPGNSPLPGARSESLREFGSSSALLGRAESHHPEIAQARSRIAAAESALALARLQRRPDITAGLSYSPVSDSGLAPSADGTDQIMGTLGITLPIWKDKNVAAEREAAANLSGAQSSLAAARASLQQRVESASATYRAERASLALYSGKLLPDARQGFDLAVTAYQAETATFLDVIDSWRQLLAYKLEHAENRARAGQAEATLRHAAGLR